MLDTHQLNVFLVAAETLNFTQAARSLHMSQPSVSQHVQNLEQSLGQQLFVRAGRHIELSEAGMALLPLAREMVERSLQIEETMKSLEGEVHGHLLVGCSTTPGKYILPQLLAKFHRQYPLVRVSCNVTSQEQAFAMICEGDVQVAMVSEPFVACSTIETRRFMIDPVVLIAPLDHPWAARGEIEAAELQQTEFIFREQGCGTDSAVRRGLASVDISPADLDTLLILGSSEAIAMSVQEGLGVGFVSQIVVSRLVQDRVAIVHVNGLEIFREIQICCQRRKPATGAQEAFWSFVEQEIAARAQLPQWAADNELLIH